MSDVQRYRKEFHKPRYFAVDSATVIEVGDMLWLDTDDVKPASDFTWDTSIAVTQRAFAPKFVGIAQDRSRAGDTEDVQVNMAGIHEMTCASATFELEDYLAPAKASGNALEDQKVVGVTDPTLAIGKVAKREAANTTTVDMDIMAGKEPGSFNSGAEIIDAIENDSVGLSADAIIDGVTNHVFTALDDTKLTGIEALADVTDATNVAAAGAVMDGDFTPAEGFMRKTGAGAYTAHKSNLNAAVGPAVGDDETAGYSVGSIWLNTTAGTAYVCQDASTGAAVWVLLGMTSFNASKVFMGTHTADAADDVAGFIDTGTGFGAAADVFYAVILRSGVPVFSDQVITAEVGGAIRVADGGATYAVTNGDVIMVFAAKL
jgi:hypothetical protein